MNAPGRVDARAVGVVGAVCAVVGIGLFIGGLLLGREQTMVSYLTAYVYAFSIACGALLWLLMTSAMGAVWPTAVRRVAEGIAGTFPILALLLLPVLFQLPVLYAWVHPHAISDDRARELVSKKAAYLNVPFFVVRAAFYVGVLTLTAELVRRWSLKQDEAPEFPARRRIRKFSAAMLGPVGLVLSFLAFDWIMSTAPAWTSSVFGLYYAAGAMLGAVCLITVIAVAEGRAGVIELNGSHRYALGRALMTLLLVWGYLGFFQLLLIWLANRPDEASWYVTRSNRGWYWMTIICIFLCHLVVPLVAIVPYRVKRSSAGLAAVAIWVLACHFFDVYWMIHPSLRPDHFDFNGMDVAMWAGVCGVCVAFGAWRMHGRPAAPWRDPEFERAIRYHSL